MDNTNIANTRSTFTALWLGFAIWVAARLGWELDVDNPTVIAIVGISGGVVWRLSTVLAQVPYLGYVLFGINKDPGYEQPTPPNPDQPAPAPEDGGLSTIETIVLVVLVVLAIFGLVYFFG